MADFVVDTLDDTDYDTLQTHTGSLGATWNKHSGYTASQSVRFISNRIYPNIIAGGGVAYLASGRSNGTEYDIVFDYYQKDSYGNFGVIARASSTVKTFYHFYHGAGSGSTQEWVIALHVNGAVVSSWTATDTLSDNTNYLCKVEVRDAAKKIYLWDGANWDQMVSTTNNTITTAGRVGVRSAFQYGDNEGKQIGSFTATDLSSPPVGRASFLMIGD
jgi:hypothetical protein